MIHFIGVSWSFHIMKCLKKYLSIMESPLNLPKSDPKISKIIPKFQNHPYKNYTKTETNHLHLGSASPVKAASVASAQASWDKPPI